jgi:hypothetical protein
MPTTLPISAASDAVLMRTALSCLAGECARVCQRPVTLFARKGADCLGKYHGDAERSLRLIFEEAQRLAPAIVSSRASRPTHQGPALCCWRLVAGHVVAQAFHEPPLHACMHACMPPQPSLCMPVLPHAACLLPVAMSMQLLMWGHGAAPASQVFLDELDALAPARSVSAGGNDQIYASVVCTLLALLDGLQVGAGWAGGWAGRTVGPQLGGSAQA